MTWMARQSIRRLILWLPTSLFLLSLVLPFLAPNRGIISNIIQVFLALISGIACIVNARNHQYPFVWRMIGIGVLMWTLGQTMWTLMGTPAVSVADIPFAGGLLVIAIALLIRPLPHQRRYDQIGHTLDLVVASFSLLTIASHFIFGPLFRANNTFTLETVVQLAYPMFDLMIIIGAFRIASRQQIFGQNSPWRWIIIGTTFFALTDLLFAYLSFRDLYEAGSFIDLGWILALTFYLKASNTFSIKGAKTNLADQQGEMRWSSLLPYLPLIFLFLLLIYDTFTFDAHNIESTNAHRQLMIFASLISLLGLLRQGLAIYDNQQLNQALQAQTETLTARNKELEIARIQAEVANDAKNAFLATMSHELRTPLSTVISAIDYIQDDFDTSFDPEVGILLANAETASHQLVAMIDDILAFSQTSEGTIILKPEPLDLAHHLATMCDTFQPQAQKKGLRLECLHDPTLPPLICLDSYRLHQIVVNLLANAIKFTQHGSIIVQTKLIDAAHFAIEVADTGIGIAQEKLETVWDVFVQADTSSTRKYGGTGLGLAIVKHIVSALHGTIAIKSMLDQGTTITLTLPLITPEGVASESSNSHD